MKKLSIVIVGAALSALCFGLETAQAHPGHSPFSPHEITPLSPTASKDVLIVPPDRTGRPSYSVFTGTSTFLATGQDTGGQFSFFDLTVRPNGGGPPPHIHNDLDEAFYVLDGNLQFLLGNETAVAKPGTYVYVPKGRRHQFLNPGTTTGRLLAITFPSGFEGFFAEEGRLITDPSNPPPPRTDFTEIAPIAARYDTALALEPETSIGGLKDFIFVSPGAPGQEPVSVAGGLYTALANFDQTDGVYSLFDVLLPPQAGFAQQQSTDLEDRSFYVLDGEVTFRINDKTTTAKPGTFVYLPRGTSYAYQNLGNASARTLLLRNPARVPEPTSTLSLLGLGAIGAVSLLKRKQKQQSLA